MKNLILTSIALIGMSTVALAQPEDSTMVIEEDGMEIIISGNDIQFDGMSLRAMLTEFKQGMEVAADDFETTLDDIDARLEAGEITEEQAEEEREAAEEEFDAKAEMLAERLKGMGEAMESRAEATAEEWEQWGEQWDEDNFPRIDTPNTERERHLTIDENGVRIEDRIREDIIIDDNDGYDQGDGFLGIHVGINQLYNADMEMAGGFATIKPESSLAVDLEMGHKFRIGRKSPLFFQYGLNLSWHSFRTRGSVTKVPDMNNEPTIVFLDRTDVNVTKTELDITYLDVPLMLSLDFSGREMDESFTLGVGGYGGIRLATERETEYTDFYSDEVSEVIDDNFLTNQFRYGVMAQVGWGSVKVTAKYDLNTLFNQSFDTPDYQVGSVTLGLML